MWVLWAHCATRNLEAPKRSAKWLEWQWQKHKNVGSVFWEYRGWWLLLVDPYIQTFGAKDPLTSPKKSYYPKFYFYIPGLGTISIQYVYLVSQTLIIYFLYTHIFYTCYVECPPSLNTHATCIPCNSYLSCHIWTYFFLPHDLVSISFSIFSLS